MLSIGFSTFSARYATTSQPIQSSAPAVPPASHKHRRRQRQLKSKQQKLPNDRSASYSRFSSDHQRDESITDQQRKCRECAEGHGHSILPDLEFSDERISGTKRNREGLTALMEAARRGEFNVVYVFSLSRLARASIITMPLLKELVDGLQIRFISISENIDSDRDGWEIIAAFMSLIHEQFVNDLSHNVRRGQEGAALDGFSVGDWCLGYGSEPVPGTAVKRRGREEKPRMRYVINLDHAIWVQRIFFWFVTDRRCIKWIARELNRNKAPKDHRSTTDEWYGDLVISALQNQKYIGVWPWGENKNKRHPITGNVQQEPCSDEECAAYTRHYPDLQIISEEMFTGAQAILAENADRWEASRTGIKGRLRGSTSDAKFGNPVHLVSGLFECNECGQRLIISGSGSKCLNCRSYERGTCTSKTQLPRQLAEKMILDAIGERILNNSDWLDAVWTACQQTWRQYCDTVPAAIQSVERQIAEVDQKIRRLLDRIEAGDESHDIAERRIERQSEKTDLINQLRKLKSDGIQSPEEPTEVWLRDQMSRLGETLQNGTPAAAAALKTLVGGKIVVERLPKPGKKSFFWRGRFTMDVQNVCGAIGAAMPLDSDSCRATSEEIVLNFVDLDDNEEIIRRARELYEAEWLECDIGRELGVGRACVTKYLKLSYAREGRELPDGRKRRHDLTKKTSGPLLAESNSENVKTLWDLDLPMQEICAKLDLHRDLVTAAIRFWFESRGLPVPDGRQRRKEIRLRKEG